MRSCYPLPVLVCALQVSTRIATYHDFLVEEFCKSAFVFMSRLPVDDQLANSISTALVYYKGLLACVSSDHGEVVFSTLVRDRVWAAVQILACADASGKPPDERCRPQTSNRVGPLNTPLPTSATPSHIFCMSACRVPRRGCRHPCGQQRQTRIRALTF